MEAAAAAHKKRRAYRQHDLERTKRAAGAALVRMQRAAAASATVGLRAVIDNQRRVEAEAGAFKAEAAGVVDTVAGVAASSAELQAAVAALPSVFQWAKDNEDVMHTVALQLDELAHHLNKADE